MKLSEGEILDVRDSLKPLCSALNQRGIYFSDDDIRESLHFCLQHHKRHLKVLRVGQGSVDPLKILTWFGCDIVRKENDEDRKVRVIECTVAALNSVLNQEKPQGLKPFDPDTLKYIRDLTKNEFTGICDHGIGRNGLFLCFHAAQRAKKRIAVS